MLPFQGRSYATGETRVIRLMNHDKTLNEESQSVEIVHEHAKYRDLGLMFYVSRNTSHSLERRLNWKERKPEIAFVFRQSHFFND